MKFIYRLLEKPKNSVIGKFLSDDREYHEKVMTQLKEAGFDYHQTGGHFNGYIVVLPEHPFYGKDYDELNELLSKKDLYVHGGLTYASGDKKRCPELSKLYPDYWVLGFDTRHVGDTSEYWTEERTWEEADKLMQLAINYKD